MDVHVQKTQGNQNKAVANEGSLQRGGNNGALEFTDNRPEAIVERNLQGIIHNSPQVKKITQLQSVLHQYSPYKPVQAKENNHCSPDILKSGVENRSGNSVDSLKTPFILGTTAQRQIHGTSNTIQRDDIGLGFSDLGNKEYAQDDVFGNRTDSKGNLARFREAVGAKGPGAFVKGVASQRTEGGIQPIFTQGIKQAMAQSLTIKQNLAGFTEAQIDHAREHAPILTPEEAAAAKQYTPMYKDYGPETAELWDSMKHVEGPLKWGPDISAISVWELSHMLHNRTLFAKTQFYRYDRSEDHPVTEPIASSDLGGHGIELNEADIKSLEELGIEAPATDKAGNWFTRLFCGCFL